MKAELKRCIAARRKVQEARAEATRAWAEFSARVREARLSRGISLAKMAGHLGCSVAAMAGLEAGRRPWTIYEAVVVAAFLSGHRRHPLWPNAPVYKNH